MKWEDAEKLIVTSLGGEHHKDSGRVFWAPGDGSSSLFIIEAKYRKTTVIVNTKMILKAKHDAGKKGKDWLIGAITRDTPIVAVMSWNSYRFQNPSKPFFEEERQAKQVVISQSTVPYLNDWVIKFPNILKGVVMMSLERFEGLWTTK